MPDTGGAAFSGGRDYRYDLWRILDGEGSVAFVGLNPSTADERVSNDEWLLCIAHRADLVVAAWGTGGAHRGRGEEVRQLLAGVELYHLGLTKDVYPRHPLYLRADSNPERWA